LGKDIEKSVKPVVLTLAGNPRLRLLIQTARSENHGRRRILKEPSKGLFSKDASDYKEVVVYEGLCCAWQ
jgi:transcriptional/translational regulatory protein YebC/TACO1